MGLSKNYSYVEHRITTSRALVRKKGTDFLTHRYMDPSQELVHFGITGMRWGVRRYQNEDGTLTELGKKRYGEEGKRGAFGTKWDLNKITQESVISKIRADNYDWYAQQDRLRAQTEKDRGNIDKSNKKEASALAYEKMAADYRKLSNRGAAFIEKIIESATKSGKSVYSKSDWIEGTVPGRTWLDNFTKDPYYTMAVGNLYYSVKDDKLGLRKHEQTLNPDEKRKTIVQYYYY